MQKDESSANADPSQVANAPVSDQTDVKSQPEPTANAAAEVNARLLNESKKNKEAWQSERKANAGLRKELEDIKRAKQEEAGKYKELYEAEQVKTGQLEGAVTEHIVKTAVQTVAQKHGCVDVDALMKLADRSMLFFDKDTQSVQGQEMMIEKGKQDYPYLFSSQKTPVANPAMPNGVVAKPPSSGNVAVDAIKKFGFAGALESALKAKPR